MGLSGQYLDFIEEAIGQAFPNPRRRLRMLELGDQVCGLDVAQPTGKLYFEARGFDHTSVDLNGEHGAVARDLRKPEQFEDWASRFDVVTNSGTSEHVGPLPYQYECFQVIHNCLLPRGLMVHLVPDVVARDEQGAWVGHCRYYYSAGFFQLLARECRYEIMQSKLVNGLRAVAMIKLQESTFAVSRLALCKAISLR